MGKPDEKKTTTAPVAEQDPSLGSPAWFNANIHLWKNLYAAQLSHYAIRRELIQIIGASVSCGLAHFPSTMITALIPVSYLLSELWRYNYKIPEADHFLSDIQLAQGYDLSAILKALEKNEFIPLQANEPAYSELNLAFDTANASNHKYTQYLIYARMILFSYTTHIAPASNVWFFTQLFYTTLFLYRDVKVIYFAEKEQSKLNGIILAEFDKQFDDYFPSLNVKNRLDLQLCYLSDKKGGKSLHMIFTLTAGSISHSTLLELWSTGLIIAAYTPAHKANRFVIGLPCHEKKDPKELKKHFSKLFNEAQITASKIETMRHFFHKHKLPMAWVVAEKPFNKKHLYYWIKDVPNDYAVILEKHKIAYEVCPDGGVLLALFKDNNLHQAAFVALYQSLKPQKPAQEMSIVTPPPEPAQTTYFDNDFQGSLWTVVYRKKLKPAPADKPIATVTAVEAPLREPVFDNLPEQYRGYRRIHLKDSHYYVFVPPQSSEFEKYNKWGATGNGYVPFVVNKENTGCIKIHDDRDVRYLAAPCTEGHYQAGSSGDQSKPRAYVLFPTDYSHKKINHLTLPQDIRHMRDSFYLETKRMLCKA